MRVGLLEIPRKNLWPLAGICSCGKALPRGTEGVLGQTVARLQQTIATIRDRTPSHSCRC